MTYPFSLSRGVWALVLAGGCLSALPAVASSVVFNPAFLHSGSAAAQALRDLEQGQSLAPGRYPVQVTLNYEDIGQHSLAIEADDADNLRPCLPLSWLESIGLRRNILDDADLSGETCLDLVNKVEGAAVQFDAKALKVILSLPQIALKRARLGYVDPSRWDPGIRAAFVNYQATLGHGSGRTGHQGSGDLLLNTGVNLGPWRIRSQQSFQHTQYQRKWQRQATYVQRDLPAWRANLTLGETRTGGEVFSSEPITGMVLASDPGMFPDGMLNYAPVVSGVALSRAKLEIRQNGYLLHTSYVSPGPFVIDDLNASGTGELEVTLIEADGQVRRFTQAFATLGNLLRQGAWRYEASVGRYNSAWTAAEQPLLAQASMAHGLAGGLTLYGGARSADHYQAATVGLGKDLGILGAAAADLTHARSDGALTGEHQGNSYAVRYGKAFATNTYLRFAGYRYSTEGYRDFGEALRERSQPSAFSGNRRSRLEASISQTLSRGSSLSLRLSQDDYWGGRPSRRQFQLNWSTGWRQAQFNLFASQSLTEHRMGAQHDRQLGLSVSLPLDIGGWSRVSFDAHRSQNRWSHQASVNGYSPEKGLSYYAALAQGPTGDRTGTVSSAWQGPYGSYSLGLSQGGDYRSVNASANGSMLAHEGGITLSPMLGETIALVEVPDIEGVGLRNGGAARTDYKGYMVAPHLQPYRVNTLELTTDQLGAEVEFDNGALQVVPQRGAIVKARYAARRITRLVLTLQRQDGTPLPFGAQARDAQGRLLGILGQGGQLLVATDLAPMSLEVAWADTDAGRCQLTLDPNELPERDGLRQGTFKCG